MKIKLFIISLLVITLSSCSGCSKSGRKAQLRKATPEFLSVVENYPQFNLKRENDIVRISINKKSFSFQENRRGEYDVYMVDSINTSKLDSRKTGVLVEKIRKQISDIKQQKQQQINDAFDKTWK